MLSLPNIKDHLQSSGSAEEGDPRAELGMLLRRREIHDPSINGARWGTSVLFALVQELASMVGPDGMIKSGMQTIRVGPVECVSALTS